MENLKQQLIARLYTNLFAFKKKKAISNAIERTHI